QPEVRVRHSSFSLRRWTFSVGRSMFVFLFVLLSTLNSQLSTIRAATVTGNLTDISLQSLNTKLIFTPTNEVQLDGTRLIAGPPKILDTTSGAFSITLDTGNYTVSLPMVP